MSGFLRHHSRAPGKGVATLAAAAGLASEGGVRRKRDDRVVQVDVGVALQVGVRVGELLGASENA
eukprot:9078518-Heterocapsa_arctica.AAC.1